MSHVYTYASKIADEITFLKVCREKGATDIKTGEHTIRQFASNMVPCIASCLLPDWKYPIAVTDKQEIKYDNWGATNGVASMNLLGECVQDYWKEKVTESVDWTDVTDFRKDKQANGDLVLEIDFEE
jgi:hypothetical protein